MALPSPLIVLLRGQQTLSITGAVSETQESVTYSDGTNYRDLFPSSYTGQAWATSAGDPSTVTIPFVSPSEWMDLDDQANHVAPRNTPKTRSMMKWWSGAAGTGDVVGKCWQDQFIGYGDSATFVQ